jgi:hypothetical protein
MSRILKIDDFQKSFPTKYGLEADGSCYGVEDNLEIMVIIGYKDISDSGSLYKSPEWKKISCVKGDIIVCTKKGTFFVPIDGQGFVECSPVKPTSSQDLEFNFFPKGSLKKIGKGLVRLHPMPIEDRKEMLIYRGL